MRSSYQPYLLVAMLVAAIAGCGGIPSHEGPRSEAQLLRLAGNAMERGDYEEAGRRYVELADASSELKRPGYLLQAATALLQGNHVAGAQRVLAEVDVRKLDAAQALRARIVAARIALAQERPTEALQGLQIGRNEDAPPALRAEAHALRSTAFRRTGDALSAARELVLREDALDPADAKARTANQQALWQTLVMLSDDDLRRGARSMPQAFAGWCELALIAKSTTRAAGADIGRTVADWRARFPGHPVSQEILDLIVARHQEEISRPAHLAVLLPQSGPMAEIGQALRDGFLAAHFRRDNPAYSPSIRFYDVGDEGSAATAYAQAVADGADFVVGPLTKQAVARIEHGRITVPTLALNRSDGDGGGDRPVYEFALAPEDEARQVAERAWNDGHARALALVPEGEWGQRVLQAFEARWQALGGTLLESQTYPPEGSDFSEPIRRLLNVDESEQRRAALEKLAQQPVQFEPRRRQDADLIFMAAFPRQARLIRPQLKFHYAGGLSIYSTSHVFSGKRDPDADRDIDDVVFCDIPWLLAGPASPIRADVERLWPRRAAQYQRFYAMGADAYDVIPFLNNLKKYPYERFNGQTGVLQLDDGNRIVRQLQWARFSNGVARPLN
jgi:outer membrane PBP1 activator LpoA protein